MKKQGIGLLIAVNRYFQNISIRTLSEDTNIDIGTISRIENEQLDSTRKVSVLLNALNIDEDLVDEVIEETKKGLEDIIDNIIDAKEQRLIDEKVNKINSMYFDKCITVDLLLMNFAFIAFTKKEDLDKYLYLLEQLENQLSDYQKFILYLFYGISKRTCGCINEAIMLIGKAERLFVNEKCHAYALYHLSMLYYLNGRFIESLLNLKDAETFFKHSGNLNRIANCKQMLASLISAMGYYDYALNVSQETIDMYETLNKSEAKIISVIHNKLNILFLNEKYDEFLNESSKLSKDQIKILNNDELYIFNKIIALYMTGQFDLCKKTINACDDIKNPSIYQLIIEFVNSKVNKLSNPRKYLKQALREMKHTGHMFNYKFVLQLLADDLVKEEKYKEACKYYKMISSIK